MITHHVRLLLLEERDLRVVGLSLTVVLDARLQSCDVGSGRLESKVRGWISKRISAPFTHHSPSRVLLHARLGRLAGLRELLQLLVMLQQMSGSCLKRKN